MVSIADSSVGQLSITFFSSSGQWRFVGSNMILRDVAEAEIVQLLLEVIEDLGVKKKYI